LIQAQLDLVEPSATDNASTACWLRMPIQSYVGTAAKLSNVALSKRFLTLLDNTNVYLKHVARCVNNLDSTVFESN